MAEKEIFLKQASNFRRQAEEKAAKIAENQKALSSEETRQMLHEIQVHQIELEMQNEELRIAQADLDAARARYFDLYDLAPVGYCTISEKGLILEANLTAAILMNVDRSALVKQPISRFILKEDHDIYYLHRKQLFETGELQACDLRMVKMDGTIFFAHLEFTTAQEADSAPVSRIVLNDITEHKRVEAEKAELEVQYRQLQKAESLGRMAGAIAHHFNNQLQVVMGILELVIANLPVESDEVKNLTEAMKASYKAVEVSRLMLTYLGQTPGKHEPLDLSEICQSGLSMLRTVIPNNVIVESELPSPGPTIRANTNQMRLVLTNLVTNAWESIGDNLGTIRLTVKTVTQAKIPASKRFPIDWHPQERVYACLEVTDTGCGIANNDIEMLFDPFFTKKFTGRGLGLPVVQGIVGAHGGGVTVESELGRGSTLRVFLPVSTKEIPLQQEKMFPSSKFKEGGTVLVVDDAMMVRKIASIMLSRLGFTVLEAKDGVEAVEMFKQHQGKIRCVLSDLTMPRMDGWDTLAALRKLSPDIPVILSSGYDEAQVMVGEHPELPNAFLGKPYQLKGLRETISRVLTDQK